VWQITKGVNVDEGNAIPLPARSVFLEFESIANGKEIRGFSKEMNEASWRTMAAARELPNPRVIKTHLPICLLPPKLLDTCKVVFMARNPLVRKGCFQIKISFIIIIIIY